MSNLFWYCSLAAIGLAAAVFTICAKAKSYGFLNLIVFYLFAAGITWVGEYIALGLFNGYVYKPGVFSDPWAENLLGHLLLNTFLWPGLGILFAAYSLGYVWLALITGFYVLAEYLFAVAGLYEQHWWRYYMSAAVVVVFLLINKHWFRRMDRKRYGFTRAAIFYFNALVLIHIPYPILLLLGKQQHNVGLNDDIYLSSTLFTFVYHLVLSFLAVLFVCVLRKWYWKLTVLIIGLAAEGTLAATGLLLIRNSWKLSYTLLIYFASLLIFILLEKYSLKPCEVRNG